MLEFILPATMISVSPRGKMLAPVFLSMKQWAADRIVSSSRIHEFSFVNGNVYC